MQALLRNQWDHLRSWLEAVDILGYRDRPSGLGLWTVGDLVAHLGLGLGMLSEITPAPLNATPLTLRRYIAAYPPAASTIAAQTRELARDLGDDLLTGIDAIAADAWQALERIESPVVMGRRGALTLDDYLMTRLLELVVHGDDLRRPIPFSPSPVLDDAANAVAEALALAYREVAGHEPDALDRMAWIRLATGRSRSDDPYLPLL